MSGPLESAISREDQSLEPLSYFFGAWLGDGWLTHNSITRNYSVNMKCMDAEIPTRCYNDITNYFLDLPKARLYDEYTKSGTHLYKVTWWNKEFSELVFFATAGKTQLPEYIWESSKRAKLDMLAGLLDTDGTIVKHKNYNNWHCSFSGTKGFVRQFPDLCRVSGIRLTNKYHEVHASPTHADRDIYNVSISSLLDNGFNFSCIRKQQRLDDYSKTLRPSQTTRSDAKA